MKLSLHEFLFVNATAPFLFYPVHFISNPTYRLDIFWLAGIVFNFLSETADMGSNIAVILKIFTIPDIIINFFFGKRYPLMKCQNIKNTEFYIGQIDFFTLLYYFILPWHNAQSADVYVTLTLI